MKRPHQKHCTDEQLLGHLDGELSRWLEHSVQRHLKCCWECRRQLSELEEQIRSVSRLLRDAESMRLRSQRARARFALWQSSFEKQRAGVPRFGLLSGFSWRREIVGTAGLAIVCLVAVLGWFWWAKARTVRSEAVSVLAQSHQNEQRIYKVALPVHHTFQVEIVEMRPQHRSRQSQLEIWSKPDDGRYAARWKDADGRLKQALWRPRSDAEYLYDASQTMALVSGAGAPVESISLMDLSRFGLTLEQIESGFMKWVASQRWRPISLSGDLMSFCNRTGVVLRAEPFQPTGGRPMVRLSAEKTTGELSIAVIMEVDLASGQPQFQKVRFRNGYRTTELRLSFLGAEVVRSQQPVAALFEPDVPIAVAARLASKSTAPVRPQFELPAKRPSTTESEEQLLALDVSVHQVLHRLNACLWEPVEILPQPPDRLRVWGMARTQERKQELMKSLQSIPGVIPEIQTVDEALAFGSTRRGSGSGGPTELSGETAQTQPIRSGPPPIQELLQQHFQKRAQAGKTSKDTGTARVQAEINDMSNQAISLSLRAWSEGWALRRLVERYPASRSSHLAAAHRELLRGMIRDHLSELRALTATSRLLLEPIFSPSAFETPALGTGAESAPSGILSNETTDLGVLSRRLVDTCNQARRLTNGLFASGSLTDVPEKAIPELLATMNRLDQGLAQIERVIPQAPSSEAAGR